MSKATAKFSVGQLIHNKLFGYRGVIFDVDPYFHGSTEWYDHVATTKPPKDRPWYHVLVDGAGHTTYVAERNLEADTKGGPIRHAELNDYFQGMSEDRYIPLNKDH